MRHYERAFALGQGVYGPLQTCADALQGLASRQLVHDRTAAIICNLEMQVPNSSYAAPVCLMRSKRGTGIK
eukprot:scaffold499630_cov18-Prasinocladus_malaysianus.AAC.1